MDDDQTPVTSSHPQSRAQSRAKLGSSTELKEYVDERTHDAETRLLRAFGDYQDAETPAI